VLIAGPNLSIDRTIGIDRFDLGHIHRVEHVEARVGGGGANAARVARSLGAQARLITIVPQLDAHILAAAFARDGVEADWVHCGGQTRIATILREPVGRLSVLNEPGPTVDAHEWEAFTKLAAGRLRRGEVLLCSGSLPPGAPVDGYAYLAREARHMGCRCVVDAAGRPLEAILETGEGILTPNLAEAESVLYGPRAQVVHADDDPPERAREAADALLHRGATNVVVTAGKAGAAYAEQGPRGRRGWVAAPEVETQSPIGAGDAFAAGLGFRLEHGAARDQAVAYAVAVAAAHVESPAGALDSRRVDELLVSPARAG
jgi:1-phosphofructokinase family hexose kinase